VKWLALYKNASHFAFKRSVEVSFFNNLVIYC